MRRSRPARRSAARTALAAALAVVAGACAGPARAPSPAVPPAAPTSASPHPAPSSAAPAPSAAEPPGTAYGREPAVQATRVETEALGAAAGRLAARGAPRTSAALSLAARELAALAATGAEEPLAREHLRGALARAGAYDPAPAAYLVRTAPDRAAAALADVIPRGTATHVGAGAAQADGSAFVVVLASDRKVRLEPVPRRVAEGATATIAGALLGGLTRPRVFVTSPAGAVHEEAVSGGPDGFRARVAFAAAGRHVVEVLAHGRGGPEVAALLEVQSGAPAAPAAQPVPARRPAPEPGDAAAAEAGVVRAINALRAARGLQAVTAAPRLTEAARAHSANMLAQGKVAHVLPGTGELVERLARARIAYRRAYENVARASTALEAHQAAEESPAHLGNLLQPGVSSVGVGIARGRLSSGDPTVYLTEILIEPPDDGGGSRLTPDARVREAIWAERARLGRAPLTADLRLDALAREAAVGMRARDETDPGDVEVRALKLRRRIAAVDVFVVSGPGEAARSANVGDGRFARVGVGAVQGDSRRFGPGRLFVAVIYTD
ncbi:SCP-like extracellular protein [Anaeromyxobacter sp. K]|uniref:CAP domain-containing protein n=1 Tax=Anaeromyxobacter sp. (strain K) TaxID=447217 RepID=UPI00015F90A0|nr:CAP domain-containing protein [Anaeromyxobacter sp. K]ACG73485.1 SCP-like extracellular protein [Anaeromyxobacter sp. K]